MTFLLCGSDPPEIKLHNTRIGQEVGKETILECIISASPQHVTRWRRGDEVFHNYVKDKYEVNVYDDNTEPNTIVLSLRIMRVEPADYGSYVCEASNNFGKALRTMELYEVRPKQSSTTTTTTTSTTTSTTTTITSRVWMHGKGGFSDHNSPHQRHPDTASGHPGYPDGVVSRKEGRNGGAGGYGEGSPPGARPSGQLGSGGAWPYGDCHTEEVTEGDSEARQQTATTHTVHRNMPACFPCLFLWTNSNNTHSAQETARVFSLPLPLDQQQQHTQCTGNCPRVFPASSFGPTATTHTVHRKLPACFPCLFLWTFLFHVQLTVV
ncbi:hypothetical protein ACOMHN_020012 [Nucella lapillus]